MQPFYCESIDWPGCSIGVAAYRQYNGEYQTDAPGRIWEDSFFYNIGRVTELVNGRVHRACA